MQYQPACMRCDAWGAGVTLDGRSRVVARGPWCRACGALDNSRGDHDGETRADSSRGDLADVGPSDPADADRAAEPADPPPEAEGQEDDPEWTRGTVDEGAGEGHEESMQGTYTSESEGEESRFGLIYDKVGRVGAPDIDAAGARPLLGHRWSFPLTWRERVLEIFTGLEEGVNEVLAADAQSEIDLQAEMEGRALVANLFAGKRVVDAAADPGADPGADHTEANATFGARIDRLIVQDDVAGKMKE